jgi:hypothetical protein
MKPDKLPLEGGLPKGGQSALETTQTGTGDSAVVSTTPCLPAEVPASANLETRAAVDGVVCGAIVAVDYGKRALGDAVDMNAAMKVLRESVDAVNAGDMRQAEGMLLAQASALNGIFTALARSAARSLDTSMAAADFQLRLALKAQAQCRATLETLANVKNPRAVAFVRQANITQGPQQVNNDGKTLRHAATHAGETCSAPNELLENDDGKRLDFRAQGAAGRADPHLEAMGALNRAQ